MYVIILVYLLDLTDSFHKFATELPAPGPDEPLYRNVVGPNQVRPNSEASSLLLQTHTEIPISGPMKQQSQDFVKHLKSICLK